MAKEDGIDDGEDGGVGADSEGEGKDSDDGKPGGFAQNADGVAQVLGQDLDGRYTSLFATLFRCNHDTAKLQSCLSLCLGRIRSVALVLPRWHFDVKLQFFLQLFIHPATEKQRTQSQTMVLPPHITPFLILWQWQR